MLHSKDIIIYGNGEIAALAKFYFENDSEYNVCGFVVDDEFLDSERFENLPLIGLSDTVKTYPPNKFSMFVALSYSELNMKRQKAFENVREIGYYMPSYISSKSVFWDDIKVGSNCLILENQTIQPTAVIGDNVMIWSGNHIGHGCQIKDHAYIASHAVLSGHTCIGERCFIGVNATIRDFVEVGDDSFITMGALVNNNVKPGSVVMGPSSEVYESDSRQASFIKKKYFG